MSRNRFCILSVDGGGLKGLIAVKVLEAVSAIIKKPLTDGFDLFAGTSTGGLIVSALNVHEQNKPLHSLAYLEELYMQVGQAMLLRGTYEISADQVQKFVHLLSITFGERRLSDTLKPVFVPTYDLSSRRIVVFKSRAAGQNAGKDILLTDVCKATSAIPPVFPPHSLMFDGKMLQCVDAGVHYLKNPAIAALAEVWKHRDHYAPGISEEDIALVSVSTGSFAGKAEPWTTDISGVLREGGVDLQYIREQQLKIDLQKIRFLRIDLDLGSTHFSVQHFVNLMNNIAGLEKNAEFRRVLKEIMM